MVRELKDELVKPDEENGRARRVVELMAFALQGALLVRYSPPAVADAFSASRVAGDWGHALGTLPAGLALHDILERACLTS